MERSRLLVRVLADVLGRAADDLRSYALKRESLRRYLLNEEELYAYHQTIARLAGHRELARPWRIDDDFDDRKRSESRRGSGRVYRDAELIRRALAYSSSTFKS